MPDYLRSGWLVGWLVAKAMPIFAIRILLSYCIEAFPCGYFSGNPILFQQIFRLMLGFIKDFRFHEYKSATISVKLLLSVPRGA